MCSTTVETEELAAPATAPLKNNKLKLRGSDCLVPNNYFKYLLQYLFTPNYIEVDAPTPIKGDRVPL